MRAVSRIAQLGFTLVLMVWMGAASAQVPPEVAEPLSEFAELASDLEGRLENGVVLDEDIEAERVALEEARKTLTDFAAAAEEAKAPLVAELEALGPAPEEGVEEPDAIAEQRARLGAEIAEIETRAKLAQQEATRARTLLDRLNTLRRDRFTERLLERQESPLGAGKIAAAWDSISQTGAAINAGIRTSLAVGGERAGFADRFALPILLAVIALFIAFLLRRWVVDWLNRQILPDSSQPRKISLGILIALARMLLPAAAVVILVIATSGTWFDAGAGEQIIAGLVSAAVIVIGANALGRAFYAPGAPEIRISDLNDVGATSAHYGLMFLAIVVAAHRLVVGTGEDIGLSIEALMVLNAGLLVLGGLALWVFVHRSWIGRSLDTQEEEADEDDAIEAPRSFHPLDNIGKFVRILGLIAAVLAPVLALVGYYRASQFVFIPLVQSGALIGICLLIYDVTKGLAGSAPQAADSSEPQQGRGAIPVLIGFLLTVAVAPLLALIWGADQSDLLEIWGRVVDGFVVGDVQISPIDFLMFAIVFAIGYILTRMVQGVLRRSVLPLTRLDQGAKSAALAGVGYVGVVIAALVAISTTGLDLSNLAIVAGALSVGIGFGLQNVVNNFVSGIILLIERPIKTGDWVEIGGKHGTVRKVNVRSTEIQTFDRSTMFVPNADLISGTVTNWTHGNSLGRLIVPVGVAYGCDARHVEKVLLEIAQAHPMLMRRPAPYVVLVGFGADSLDFEIRGVLRDVNWILNVGSDIRFSVYERFTKEGIEIPFAQRDIFIKNLGDLAGGNKPEAVVSKSQATTVPSGEGDDAPEGGGDGEAR